MKIYKLISIVFVFLFSTLLVFSQEIQLRGIITDENNIPLPGANILIKGTHSGTITDMDGNYTITVPSSESSLIFSFLGYFTKEITVGTQIQIDVQLVPDIASLEEIVVIGYGTSKAKDLTAPIATVHADEIVSQVTANPAQALQGKVAGVMVINNGSPGSEPQIRIRGIGTALKDGGGKPLYVVDGVIVENISFLNNNDVESISILKDASAGAIYGVQAANGVIIVTTKKGTREDPRLNYSTYAGFQQATNVLEMATKDQYIELLNQRTGLTGAGDFFDPDDYQASTNWYDELLRTPLITNHEISLSGGSERSSYSFGASYFKQEGILNTHNDNNNNNFTRFNFRAKNDYYLNKTIDFGYNIIFSKSNTTEAYNYAFFQAFITPPAYTPRENDTTWSDPTALGFSGPFANPVASAYYFDKVNEEYTIIPSTYLKLNLYEGLTFRTSFSGNLRFKNIQEFIPEYYVSGLQNNTNTQLDKINEQTKSYYWDNLLTYEKNISSHFFKVLLGHSLQEENFSWLKGTAYNVPDAGESSNYITLGDDNSRTADDGGEKSRVFSLFSRLNYSFNSKYLLTLTIRADASSKYDKKTGYFPSVGVGWVLSEEKFIKNSSAIDFLKLRISWGKLGNNNIPARNQVIVGNPGPETTGVFGGDNLVPGLTFQTVYNHFLNWEIVEEYDAGFEISTLAHRLTAEVDYYYRITHDAVFSAPIAGVSGTDVLLGNNGKILNNGIEISLGWSDKPGSGKFQYHVKGHITTIHNEVLEINNEAETIYGPSINGSFVTRTQPGLPIGAFYGYNAIGVFQSNTEIEEYTGSDGSILQPDAIPGDLKFEDVNGDNTIDANDRTYLGSPTPKLLYGLNAGFAYGKFDASIDINGVLGNKIFNAKRIERNVFPDANYDLDFYENHWTGKESTNEYPSAALTRKNIQPNSFFVESGWYIRIRNIQVGYTPFDSNEDRIVKDFRIYLSAQNPFTYFKYNGYTPEVSSNTPIEQGIDRDTYPLSSTYIIGLNISF
ncbi:TonB-dependent receptor P3 [subsurface metagenome]